MIKGFYIALMHFQNISLANNIFENLSNSCKRMKNLFQGLANLFQDNDPEEDVEVTPDVGAPVTEGKKWGLQEKAFDDLIVDDEKIERKKQKEKGKDKQKYVSGN